jgi:hypothetical protein
MFRPNHGWAQLRIRSPRFFEFEGFVSFIGDDAGEISTACLFFPLFAGQFGSFHPFLPD